MLNLSAPRLLTFALSLVLAALAVASLYLRIPQIGHFVAAHRTGFLIAAYAVLAASVVAKSL